MKFQHDGRTFRLEFERKYKSVNLMRNGKLKTVRSTYPYTTATLYELKDGEEPKVFARGTVGCLPADRFSNKTGRLFALRELTRATGKSAQQKEFRAAIWNAYLTRAVRPEIIDPKPAEKPVVASAPILLKALPPAREATPTIAREAAQGMVHALANLDSRIIH